MDRDPWEQRKSTSQLLNVERPGKAFLISFLKQRSSSISVILSNVQRHRPVQAQDVQLLQPAADRAVHHGLRLHHPGPRRLLLRQVRCEAVQALTVQVCRLEQCWLH